MAGLTNRDKKLILDMAFRAQNEPTYYYMHLFTSSATITADTNTFSDLSNEASGGGYGEATLARGTVKFDTVSEDDSGDELFVVIKGEVAVTVKRNSGKSHKVAALKKGDFFGEMSLMTGDSR